MAAGRVPPFVLDEENFTFPGRERGYGLILGCDLVHGEPGWRLVWNGGAGRVVDYSSP